MTLANTIQDARAYLAPQDVDCVVYHSPCNDGSGAALSAWLLLGDKAHYQRLMYHEPFVEESVRDKNVIVVDASFKKEQFLRLRTIAKKIMILDHHYSAMEDLAGESGCFFCMDNSGAILSWHYFHGIDATPPRLLSLIEDRDLWRWHDRPQSEPLYYALRTRCPNSNFKSYIPYVQEKKLQDLIAYGQTLVAENHRWCEQAALKARERIFIVPGTGEQYKIMCREVDNDKLVSELSEYLYTKYQVDFILLWSRTNSGQYKLSFRTMHKDINLGAIAAALGGGGHKQAAGAVLNVSPEKFLQ